MSSRVPNGSNLSRRSLLATLASGVVASSVAPAFAAATKGAAAVPPSSRTSFTVRTRDGLTLAAEGQGDVGAPEIVFVHGLRQSRQSWDRQFDAAALAGYRLIRFDLRGHGDSDKPNTPAAYSDLGVWGDDLESVLEVSQARRPVVVGWSLGGAVIGGYLLKRSDPPIAGINLVDGVTKFSPDYLTPASLDFAGRTSQPDLVRRSAAIAEFLRACFVIPPGGSEFEELLVINGMMTNAVNAGLSTAGIDLDPALRAYKGPLLLTHGAHDGLLKVAMSEHNRDLHAGAILSVYKACGHSPFYENAPRFNRELGAFVQASRKG